VNRPRIHRINMDKTNKGTNMMQFLKFNIVGLLNTAIDFVIYAALLWAGAYIVLAQVIAYGAGMLNSYIWNSRFTFKGQGSSTARSSLRTALRFALWNGIVLGISILLLLACDRYTPISGLYAKAVVTVITVFINFYGSKRFVFRGLKE